MQLQNINNTTFSSRNKVIRAADDIARRVNICYPRISSSLTDDFVNIHCFRQFKKNLNDKTENVLRTEISDSFEEADNFIGKIVAFVKPIKKYRLGNCGESAQLSSIVAQVNGIKNCFIASLKTSKGKDLDHSVLFVNDKKPYIIDAWLGFADYIDNAFLRYKKEFGIHFNAKPNDKLVFKKLETDYTEVLNKDFTRAQINKIRRLFPEQFIKRGYV